MEKQIEQFLEDLITNLENIPARAIRIRALKLLRGKPTEKRNLYGDGITTYLSEEVYEDLINKIAKDGKIAGIKYLRDNNPYVNIGLRGLKEMVEQVIKDENIF